MACCVAVAAAAPAADAPIPPPEQVSLVWLVAAAAGVALFVAAGGPRLRQRRDPMAVAGTPLLLALAGGALLLQQIGAAMAVGLFVGEISSADLATPRVAAIAMAGAIAAQLPIVAVVWQLRRPARQAEPPRRGVAVLAGLVAVAVAWPLTLVVSSFAAWLRLRLAGLQTEAIAHDTLRMIVQEPGWPSRALALMAIVAIPVVEEVLYRGLGHGIMRRLGAGPWTTIVIVAALFAMAHVGVVPAPALAALFVLGVAFGWSAERTGSLTAPIAGHIAFNAINIALAI